MTDKLFDAIVIGSGITGGWAAKELTERGLKVLMLERGEAVRKYNPKTGMEYKTEHEPVYDFKFRLLGDKRRYARDYPIQSQTWFFNEATEQYWVNDRENPYSTPAGKPFYWIRGHHIGGRSLMWGRQSYRFAPRHFEENARDGHGVDWPIRYADLEPWYGHVERFIGVGGSPLNNAMSPDGEFRKPYPLNAVERDFQSRLAKLYPDRPLAMARMANLLEPMGDRGGCHWCGPCERGCTVGAYFSTQSSTLPAAKATGNLTVQTNAIARAILVDNATGRADGVRVIDANSRAETVFKARMIFLCASSFESVRLLFNSSTERFPNGMANSSGVLGHYIMDHAMSDVVAVEVDGPQVAHYTGYRPGPLFIPRFRNVVEQRKDYVRGYQYNSGASLQDWGRGASMAGVGVEFKNALRRTGKWQIIMVAQCECLPRKENRISIDPNLKDAWGVPALHIDMSWSDNEAAMREEAADTAIAMLTATGFHNIARIPTTPVPGLAIHEMGGAPMGRDARTSVLNAYNQTHDVPNLFVTDGAAMCSSSCTNPSLTYMALTARDAAFAADRLKKGLL